MSLLVVALLQSSPGVARLRLLTIEILLLRRPRPHWMASGLQLTFNRICLLIGYDKNLMDKISLCFIDWMDVLNVQVISLVFGE
jgi:hypothetical protein